MDKDALLGTLRDRLAARLSELVSAHQSVQAGAFHPDNKQEHSKDTRAIEGAYLARGLAERVEILRDACAALSLMPVRDFRGDDPAAIGALVELIDEDDETALYLLAPAGGGEKLACEAGAVLVLTPSSPLGAALVGRRCRESVEVDLPAGKMVAEIASIR